MDALADEAIDCWKKRHPEVAPECIEEARETLLRWHDSIPPDILGELYHQYLEELCELGWEGFQEAIAHSSDSVSPKEPDREWTRMCFKTEQTVVATPPSGGALALTGDGGERRALDDELPCGESEGAITLCASSGPFPEGDFVTMSMVFAGEIPPADPTYHHQYAFVFDADGDESNNYRAPAAFPNDFFDNTDRWYVATYAPGRGWTLEASRASEGAIEAIPSDARIAILGSSMLLVLPAAELPSTCPSYRMTAFTHTGDFGLEPPHEWSADVEPAVSEPLHDGCHMVNLSEEPSE